MKRIFILALCCITVFSSCQCSNNSSAEAQEEDTCFSAINKYMTTEIGSQYSEGEFSIPFSMIVKIDDTNLEDILVYGDFWVENFNMEGDTLKTVSGGSHPGCMHVCRSDNGFTVTAFDAVEDGAGFNPSAKALFGDYYDSFVKMQSNDQIRERMRNRAIGGYVVKHDIPASYYQDYGWPAVAIKK